MQKLSITFLFLIAGVLRAQEAQPYQVIFEEKEQIELLDSPLLFLSPRALERRRKQGIAITRNDLPVSQNRIAGVRSLVHYTGPVSKWLNSVYVEATADEVLDLIALDYVQDIQPVSGGMATNTDIPSEIAYGYSNDQVHQISLDEGPHGLGALGNGKLIAVLDAGFVGANSVNFSSNLDVLVTRNFVEGGTNVYQGSSHGFSVLSTMAGNIEGTYVGTAPYASYALIKTEKELSETPQEMFNWVAGAEFADSIGADIINSSLGYSEFDDPADNYTVDDLDGRTSVVTLGAVAAARTGMLVVTSAGNAGGSAWNKITFPADADSILTVGAVNQYGIASGFSSRGYTADGRIKPNVSARGEGAHVYRSDGTISLANGTSFSSPIMAGASACLWEMAPNATAQQVIQALEISASHFYTKNERIGNGIPNLAFAMRYLDNTVNGASNKIVVYPNPFPDYLELFLPDNQTHTIRLELQDIYGRTVVEEELLGRRYQTLWAPGDHVPAGMYFLILERNGTVQTQRIIKLQ